MGVAGQRLAGRTVDLRRGGLFDCGWSDSSFDILCMFDVMEHVPDLEAGFEAVRRLLAPGGLFVLAVPVYDGPLGPVVTALDKDPTHLHKVGRAAWLDHLERLGLRVVRWTGLFRYLLGGRRYLYLHSERARAVAPAILAFAERT